MVNVGPGIGHNSNDLMGFVDVMHAIVARAGAGPAVVEQGVALLNSAFSRRFLFSLLVRPSIARGKANEKARAAQRAGMKGHGSPNPNLCSRQVPGMPRTSGGSARTNDVIRSGRQARLSARYRIV